MIQPTQIVEESNAQVSIKWSDDSETSYSAAALRCVCPCATCVNEWTGEKILREDSISDDLWKRLKALFGLLWVNIIHKYYVVSVSSSSS